MSTLKTPLSRNGPGMLRCSLLTMGILFFDPVSHVFEGLARIGTLSAAYEERHPQWSTAPAQRCAICF
jgi:hypothetical protein